MSQFALFGSRRFAPLFATQLLGALNDNVYRFALVIFITFTAAEELGVDAPTLVVLSGGIFILPFFLFSAVAGALADKYEKSRLIRRVKLLEIVVMGLGAIGFWLRDPTFLLVVLFLMGAQSAFFGPLKYGILPQHLREDELTGGNGLIQMGTYVAILGGAMLGGLLAGIEQVGPWLVVGSVVAIATCGWLASCQIPEAAPSARELVVDWRIDRATWRLLRDALAERTILTLVLCISWFWFLGATFLGMVPTYGKELLGGNEAAVTLLNVAFTIGIGIGALACESLSRKRVELGLVPFACVGVSLCALDVWLAGAAPVEPGSLTLAEFARDPRAVRFFLDLVGMGAFGAVYIVPLNAAVQLRAAAHERARVIAALNVVNAAFMVGSAVFTTILYQLEMSLPSIFALTALLNLAVMAAAIRALPEFPQRLRAMVARLRGS